jgi:hypothetical protein
VSLKRGRKSLNIAKKSMKKSIPMTSNPKGNEDGNDGEDGVKGY